MPFNIVPSSFCKVTYTCSSVVRKDLEASGMDCDDIDFPASTKDCTDSDTTCEITLSVTSANYQDGDFKPGVFVVTMCGEAVGSTGPKSKCTEVEITLTDPCDPPTSFIIDAYENKSYIITDSTDVGYSPPFPTISPSYCKFT